MHMLNIIFLYNRRFELVLLDQGAALFICLVFKTSLAGVYHGCPVFVAGFNGLVIIQ